MADALARDAWATHAAGEGAKGLRLYEWARIALSSTAAPGFEHWLLTDGPGATRPSERIDPGLHLLGPHGRRQERSRHGGSGACRRARSLPRRPPRGDRRDNAGP